MKNIKYLITTFFLVASYLSSAQNWQWSKQIGGSSHETSRVMCIDANNNIYLSGTFWSSPCYFNSDTLNATGGYDFFIAKYDPSGNELWVKSFGGNNTQMQFEGLWNLIYDVNANNLIMSGVFYGTSIFGNDTLTGNPCGFLARMDLNGNFIWANKKGGGFIAIDAVGNIFEEFASPTSFNIDTLNLSSGTWFTKWDTNGNFLWAKKKFNYSGNYEAMFYSLEIKEDKIFAVGETNVANFTVDTVNVTSNYANGQYIIGCFDTSANALWIKTCGSANPSWFDVIVDNDKNNYFTGSFYQEGIFGNDTLHAGSDDLFVSKYDSLGNKIWVNQVNPSSWAIGRALAFDIDGNFYLTGSVLGNATFGSFSITPAINSMFLARYDTSGICIGLRHTGFAGGGQVVTDNSGNVYAGGSFSNSITFDSNPTLTSYGQGDVYIAKSSAITGIGGRQANPNNQLIIYANPNKGTCTITIPDDLKNEKNLTLTLYDNTGKVIQKTPVQMQADKVKVNLEQEATGVYNVTLSNAKKSYNGKIVFE